MNTCIVQQVKEEFDHNKNSSDLNYKTIKENIVYEKISRGRLFNITPYENESDGLKKGQAIKSRPQNMKNIVIYSFNEFNNIILMEEYGTVKNPYREYFYYCENTIKRYRYDTSDHLIYVKYVIMQEDKVKEVYHYAEYGFRYEEYFYDNDTQVKIVSQEKEHNKEEFLTREINFYYDENNTLCLIEQDNLNGYIQELYPKLGKWKTVSEGNR